MLLSFCAAATISGSASIKTTQARQAHAVQNASNNNVVLLHVQYSESAWSMRTGYMSFGTPGSKSLFHS